MKKQILLFSVLLFTVLTSNAQVGVGNNTIDDSAILDLNVSSLPANSKKGFLGPRVALKNATDVTVIPSPAIGLLIYNLGTEPTFTLKGYLFWDGAEWRQLDNSTSAAPAITSLTCATATLSPSSYTSGVPYSGFIEIPYIGGNGGAYSAGTASSAVNGLTMTLIGNKLQYGSGKIVYSVSGIPTVTSPVTTTFPISFLSNSCNVKVGKGESKIESAAFIGPLTATTNPAAGAEATLVTPDGQYEVRFYIGTGQGLDLTDLQIRYIGSNATSTIMWQGGFFYSGGAGGYGGNSMTMTKNVWWGSNGAANGSVANTAWGDPDVYYFYPEYRHYAWTSTSNSEKVTYMARFFMGAPTFAFTDYNNAKAVILIEQVSSN